MSVAAEEEFVRRGPLQVARDRLGIYVSLVRGRTRIKIYRNLLMPSGARDLVQYPFV